jgi:integrase
MVVDTHSTVGGLTFFFKNTLCREDLVAVMKKAPLFRRRVPNELMWDELISLVRQLSDINEKIAASHACLMGLDAEDLVSLKIADVDNVQMRLWLPLGRYKVSRGVDLSTDLLVFIRRCWAFSHRHGRVFRRGWLIPGSDPTKPMNARQLGRSVRAAAARAGISQTVTLKKLHTGFWHHLHEVRLAVRQSENGSGPDNELMEHCFKRLLHELTAAVLTEPSEPTAKGENQSRVDLPRAMTKVGRSTWH